MANAILAYPNYVDADTSFAKVEFEGGWWEPTLPLSNLRDKLLIRRARSVNLALTSTQFWVDLGVSRDVRLVAIPFLTASQSAKIRVRGFATKNAMSSPEVDTGWKDLYPIIYPFGSLYYGHPSFFSGRMSSDKATKFRMPFVSVFSNLIIARYWLIEIDDTTSPLGYVEVPRVFIAPGWQPNINFAYGAQLGVESRTTVSESWGGAEFFDVKKNRRTAQFTFANLSDSEALVWAHDMQQELGINGQLFFVFDPDDVEHLHRRAFLARLRTLSPLEYSQWSITQVAFELVEVTT